jgi:beta-galactosidase
LKADNQDVAVIAIKLQDKKGNTIPTACQNFQIKVSGNARILGVGNGDPAYKEQQNPNNLNCKSYTVPSFNGLAQVLVQSTHEGGEITVTCSSEGLKEGTLSIMAK